MPIVSAVIAIVCVGLSFATPCIYKLNTINKDTSEIDLEKERLKEEEEAESTKEPTVIEPRVTDEAAPAATLIVNANEPRVTDEAAPESKESNGQVCEKEEFGAESTEEPTVIEPLMIDGSAPALIVNANKPNKKKTKKQKERERKDEVFRKISISSALLKPVALEGATAVVRKNQMKKKKKLNRNVKWAVST